MKRAIRILLFILFYLSVFPISAETPNNRNLNLNTSQSAMPIPPFKENLQNELEIIAEMIARDDPGLWIINKWKKLLKKNQNLDIQATLDYVRELAITRWDLHYGVGNKWAEINPIERQGLGTKTQEKQEFMQDLTILMKNLYDVSSEIVESSRGIKQGGVNAP